MRNSTTCVVKTKTLITCAVTAQLIYAFVFAYACCYFSYAAAKVYLKYCLFALATSNNSLFGGQL